MGLEGDLCSRIKTTLEVYLMKQLLGVYNTCLLESHRIQGYKLSVSLNKTLRCLQVYKKRVT